MSYFEGPEAERRWKRNQEGIARINEKARKRMARICEQEKKREEKLKRSRMRPWDDRMMRKALCLHRTGYGVERIALELKMPDDDTRRNLQKWICGAAAGLKGQPLLNLRLKNQPLAGLRCDPRREVIKAILFNREIEVAGIGEKLGLTNAMVNRALGLTSTHFVVRSDVALRIAEYLKTDVDELYILKVK